MRDSKGRATKDHGKNFQSRLAVTSSGIIHSTSFSTVTVVLTVYDDTYDYQYLKSSINEFGTKADLVCLDDAPRFHRYDAKLTYELIFIQNIGRLGKRRKITASQYYHQPLHGNEVTYVNSK